MAGCLRFSTAAKGGKRITMATILPEDFGSRRHDAVVPAVIEDREIDLRSILGMLRRRKSVIFGTVAAVLLVTMLVLIQLTPRYTASSQLMLNTRQQNVVDIETVMSGLNVEAGAFQTGVRSEINIIMSRSLARRVVEKLGLMQDPEFNWNLRQGSALDFINPIAWLESGMRWVVTAVGLGPKNTEGESGAASEPRTAEEEENVELNSVISSFLSHLTASNDGRSYSILVNFTSEDPEKAAVIANAVADQYLVDQLEAKFEATRRATAWLNERLADLREKVKESETALQEYREQSNLIDNQGQTVSAQQLSELNSQLILARTERAQVEARLRRVRELVKTGGVESSPEVLANPLIQRLREQETDLARQQAELSGRYGDRHPTMINLRAEIRDLRSKIDAEVNKIVLSLANEVEVARARESTLAANLASIQQNVGELSRASVRLNELQREADANRALFETFLNRFKETSNQDQIIQPDARIISAAETPQWPSFPRKKVILAMALGVSVFLGVFLALLIERLDNGFRSPEQVERLTGVPGLGLIPAVRASRKSQPQDYLLQKPTSAYAEALQSVRTALHFSNVDHPPKVILVTSALPEEGKTTFAVSLARIAARSGLKVVLVDADMRRPKVARILGLESDAGLRELLAGDALIPGVLHKDEPSGMHIIPSQPDTPGPQDLLGSRRMRDLIRQMSSLYDLVVIDSPPIMAVSDAIVLSGLADATLVMVRWETTPREVTLSAVRQLRQSGGRIAGAVLTRVNMRKHARFSYGDSGYYYDKYKGYYAN
jgi:succinoglycan biosynthesis transport protein ExoP